MNSRRWYYFLPLAGMAFGVWYVKSAFADVIYSDYIRLVNSYLPDVWNPEKFFVGDIFTRIPLNYLARIINTAVFDYRIRFDQGLGILSMGLGAMLIVSYCIKKNIGVWWYLCLMAMMFSLNKWEMMINGSGWIHFFAFVGFYYHYLALERLWTGQEKKGDHGKCLWLPWVLTLAVAGPYCAIYTVTLLLVYGFKLAEGRVKERTWQRRYVCYSVSAVIPLLLYIWSNAQVAEEYHGMTDIPIMEQLGTDPGYMVRFFVKSFASMVIGKEPAENLLVGNLPYMVLGLMVIGMYILALWLQIRCRLYRETVFPMILIVSGGLNHVLIWYSRWGFLQEQYGMSSRYALQFQIGIFGIILTFALAGRKLERDRSPALRRTVSVAAAAGLAVLVAGNVYTTLEEVKKAPARKEVCLRRQEMARNFENLTDEDLRWNFEFRTYNPESGKAVRNALEILKKNKWNVFRE